mmetsp:Transcript_21548/g.47289  ORF Transcript_21548/g.47289 Transcript_21548/m.47289 type:complete len:271 (+) Transcript_21548:32-844(+)
MFKSSNDVPPMPALRKRCWLEDRGTRPSVARAAPTFDVTFCHPSCHVTRHSRLPRHRRLQYRARNQQMMVGGGVDYRALSNETVRLPYYLTRAAIIIRIPPPRRVMVYSPKRALTRPAARLPASQCRGGRSPPASRSCRGPRTPPPAPRARPRRWRSPRARAPRWPPRSPPRPCPCPHGTPSCPPPRSPPPGCVCGCPSRSSRGTPWWRGRQGEPPPPTRSGAPVRRGCWTTPRTAAPTDPTVAASSASGTRGPRSGRCTRGGAGGRSES